MSGVAWSNFDDKKPVVRLSLSLTANAPEGELRSRQVLRFHGLTLITPGRTTATAEPDQELIDECFEAAAVLQSM